MKCPLCGGTLKEEKVDYEKHWGDKIYSFKNVPALICESCGDVLITHEAAKAIEEIIRKEETPDKYIEVPVYSLDKYLAKAS